MPSWASSDAVRRSMRANRPRDTGPELAVRAALHRQGLRFRKHHRPLAGVRYEADVAFPRERLAIFIDGCFWHGCPIHGSMPSSHAEFWESKLGRNRERDEACDRAFHSAGWTVVRVWEHEPVTDVVALVIAKVEATRAQQRQAAASKLEHEALLAARPDIASARGGKRQRSQTQ
jgi:DNA mismatch endonuclease (patch repair protein)